MSAPRAAKAPRSFTATRPERAQWPAAITRKNHMSTANPAGKYRHYKGGEYEVIDVAIHSETHEAMVVYRPLYGEGRLWVRPLAMFVENVVVDGVTLPRFAPI